MKKEKQHTQLKKTTHFHKNSNNINMKITKGG